LGVLEEVENTERLVIAVLLRKHIGVFGDLFVGKHTALGLDASAAPDIEDLAFGTGGGSNDTAWPSTVGAAAVSATAASTATATAASATATRGEGRIN
jgi:hypothetical protein